MSVYPDLGQKSPDLWNAQLKQYIDDNAGTPGTDGESAYEIAVANGFVGTEEEWLISLNGAPGTDGDSAYQVAVNEGFVGTQAQWLASLKGEQGDPGETGESAYDEAVSQGFVGTEQEWLASLVGPQGAQGPAGGTPLPFAVATLSGGTYTLDPTVAVDYSLTLEANSALQATAMVDGTMLYVQLIQGGAGGWGIQLPPSWLRVGDITLHTTPGQIDILVVWQTPNGILVKQVTDQSAIVPPWSPGLLSNQIGWFNAAAIAGDAGDPVDTWNNAWAEASLARSGPFTAPTLQVVNGINVVRFDAVNNAMATGTTSGWSGWQAVKAQPITYAFVVKAVVAVPGGTIPVIGNHNNGNSPTTDHSIYVNSSATGLWTMNAGAELQGAVNNVTTEFMTVVVRVNGANTLVRVNGVNEVGQGGAESTNGMVLGMNSARTRKAQMDMAELIIAQKVVQGQELADMEAYLNAKRDTLNGV